MILIDTPSGVVFRGRDRLSSHMGSDLLGEAGTAELIAFGRSIGLEERWLQNRGRPGEHFDVFDGRYAVALRQGAQPITGREFITRIVHPKRAALTAAAAATRETP